MRDRSTTFAPKTNARGADTSIGNTECPVETRNCNESFNNLIWASVPGNILVLPQVKRVFDLLFIGMVMILC